MKSNGAAIITEIGPRFDENQAIQCKTAQYRFSDVVKFSQNHDIQLFAERGKILFEPIVNFNQNQLLNEKKEPLCDISEKSQRNKDGSKFEVRYGFSVGLSVLLHISVMLIIVIYSFIVINTSDVKLANSEVIEVSFGLPSTSDLTNQSATSKNDSKLDELAQKTLQQLPQLPKLLTIDSKELPPDTLPLPKTVEATPTPKPVIEIESTPEPGVTKIKPEELLKRMEKERRAIGEIEKKGTQINPGEGAKALEEIPSDPFSNNKVENGSNIPQGTPEGKLSPQAKSYREAVKRHMLKEWKLPDVLSFSPNIVSHAEVVVNMFGKVTSVRVVKPSGDKSFDDEVVAAVWRANPFPDFSSSGIVKQYLILSFSPSGVK